MSIEMPVLRVPELPAAISAAHLSHASGGRDRWSEPLEEAPDDPTEGVWDCLREVLDPEIPISLVDLGLIYGVTFEKGTAAIDLTFTATACPCMEFIHEDVTDRLEREPWIDSAQITHVWDPPWTNERISDYGRARLDHLDRRLLRSEHDVVDVTTLCRERAVARPAARDVRAVAVLVLRAGVEQDDVAGLHGVVVVVVA